MSKILKMNTQYHKSYSDKEEPQLGRNDSWPISDMTEYLKKSKDEFTSRMAGLVPRETVIKLSDLDFKKTLGQGAYGRVMLVSVRASGALYAAKLQEKKFIVKSKQINNVLNEKKLLESFTFPFTVNLEYFFQDNVYIYFVMPLMEGGDMYELLRKKGKFDEQLAKFYSAQVLLALEYLHYLDLVYRDIKPENILIDREGYIKVADYGFVKKVKDRTYTFCGTPEYIAPEIILSKGYGKPADFWSFGILLYEFNSGVTPFYANDPMRIYEKIVDGKYVLKSNFSTELKDIIRNLVQNDLTRRYGNLKNGIDDIKDHKWFRRIVWLALLNKSIRPPFVPPLKTLMDPNTKEKPLEKSSQDPYKEYFADF